jgi:hypothetical protein
MCIIPVPPRRGLYTLIFLCSEQERTRIELGHYDLDVVCYRIRSRNGDKVEACVLPTSELLCSLKHTTPTSSEPPVPPCLRRWPLPIPSSSGRTRATRSPT